MKSPWVSHRAITQSRRTQREYYFTVRMAGWEKLMVIDRCVRTEGIDVNWEKEVRICQVTWRTKLSCMKVDERTQGWKRRVMLLFKRKEKTERGFGRFGIWMDRANHHLPISSSNLSLHHKCTFYTSSPCAIFISSNYKMLCFLIFCLSVHLAVKTISQEPFERNLSNLSKMSIWNRDVGGQRSL